MAPRSYLKRIDRPHSPYNSNDSVLCTIILHSAHFCGKLLMSKNMSASMTHLSHLPKVPSRNACISISFFKANAVQAAECLTIVKVDFCSCLDVKGQVNQ